MSTKPTDLEIGKTYESAFPYVRVVRTSQHPAFGNDAYWKPGYQRELETPDGGSSYTMATDMGKRLLEVVATCDLPGRYQQRVFFKCTWVAPDGTELGGKRLEVCTRGAFYRKLEGLMPEDLDYDYFIEAKETVIK